MTLQEAIKQKQNAVNGYVSPICLIEDMYSNMKAEIIKEQENYIVKQVQNLDIYINKKELLKALNYDREQYDEGYNEGFKTGINEGYKIALEQIADYSREQLNSFYSFSKEEAEAKLKELKK